MWEHDSFAAGLDADLVFVYLDFPSGEEAKARVPNPERNAELQAKYGIQGFPTVLLMTPDGDVFGQTGYQAGGPEKYVEHVKELTTTGKAALAKIAELQAKFEAAEDKTPVVKAAIAMVADVTTGQSRVADIVRHGFELDPTNEAGLKLEALQALFTLGEAQDAELTMAIEMDAKNELGLYEKVIGFRMSQVRDDVSAGAFVDSLKGLIAMEKLHDEKMVQALCVNGAFWSHKMLERPEDAKLLAAKAASMGEVDPSMQDVLDEILGES